MFSTRSFSGIRSAAWAINLWAVVQIVPASAADDAAVVFKSRVQPVISARCAKCHGAEKPKAKLNLVGPRTLERLRAESDLWFRVQEQVESGAMPPEGEKPLTPAERAAISGWINGDLTRLLAGAQQKEGRSKFRRLSRMEYANTVTDLLGIRPPVVRDLPGDGRVDGYDKVSAALPMSPVGAAGYVKIAEDILGRMLNPVKPTERTFRLWAHPSEQSKGHILELEDGTMVSFNSDTTSGPLRTKSAEGKFTGSSGPRLPGMHRLRMSVYAYQSDKPIAFGIYAGHVAAYPQIIELLKVLEAPPGKPTIVEADIYLRTGRDSDLPTGDGMRLIPFGLGVQVPKNSQASQCKGPGLAVQWMDVEEPEQPLLGDRWLGADMPPAMQEEVRRGTTLKASKIAREEFLAAMRATFARLGARFFRRDLSEAELTKILANIAAKIDADSTLNTAIRDEVTALMTAPDFLCVIEQPGKLNDFALASRLAYFLWNSTPDEELLAAARQGRLSDEKVLREQTERLLKDAKSERFVKDFVDQWLGLRMINDTTPDSNLYPEYGELLKISSVMETQATFRRILDKDLSVRDFIAPKWALLNERLAEHYKLPAQSGFALQEVALPADTPYGGFWTQSAPMKVTANGTGTSPVKRGVWVSERLLGIHIPPPPPGVEPIDPDTRGAKTLREQLALHSSKGSCASCHARFDPYGFALESFDVTGAFRTNYRTPDPEAKTKGAQRWKDGPPVDCTGKTPDGAEFSGVKALRQLMAKRPEMLATGVARHLVTYATGAPAGRLDEPAIAEIVKQSAPGDYGLRSLIHNLVQSEIFRNK